ncbi:ABC transporter permease [Maledivibacter halophilus]|uniref:Peptide/nickel transport system permease protein n=1 Tax=Maledivibacter halophilus TaxID=36842 RepID=A0A1T5KQD2_9FIRM|nr:ABC transporter permease [Maledivibacter halophilus]SKC65695.1 peptide/nickel transport system permease protein [Maledivibacter halophilus]
MMTKESDKNFVDQQKKDLEIIKREAKANSFIKKLFRNKTAVAGLIIILVVIFTAIFAPLLAPHDPNKINLVKPCLKPGTEGHILGTDEFGRDMLSRVIYGSRISIIVGVCATALGALIGIVIGLISGYKGGKVDTIIMRFMDGMFAFPFILLAIIMMTVLGSGLQNVIFAIGIANIPYYARIVRGQVLIAKEEDYCQAVKALGASNFKIIKDHIIPNIASPIIVYATLNIAGTIISEAGLSFLGLGIQPPISSWGNILKSGKDYLLTAPHIATFSGLAILITVIGFNLFGDGVRDALDPKLNK